MTFNPAFDLPLSDIPHSLVVVPRRGYVYVFNFPSEPEPEEYLAGVDALRTRIITDLGIKIHAKYTPFIYRPTTEVRWDEIRRTLEHEPVYLGSRGIQ